MIKFATKTELMMCALAIGVVFVAVASYNRLDHRDHGNGQGLQTQMPVQTPSASTR